MNIPYIPASIPIAAEFRADQAWVKFFQNLTAYVPKIGAVTNAISPTFTFADSAAKTTSNIIVQCENTAIVCSGVCLENGVVTVTTNNAASGTARFTYLIGA